MFDNAFTPAACPVPIPVGELLPWAISAGLILLLAIYFVHEFVHDGRHLLGFPCH